MAEIIQHMNADLQFPGRLLGRECHNATRGDPDRAFLIVMDYPIPLHWARKHLTPILRIADSLLT
jgi:hypothetical protein